jgi:hypothetical protein
MTKLVQYYVIEKAVGQQHDGNGKIDIPFSTATSPARFSIDYPQIVVAKAVLTGKFVQSGR